MLSCKIDIICSSFYALNAQIGSYVNESSKSAMLMVDIFF